MKTVGIIGGSGFIGSHITRIFLEEGFKVRVSTTDLPNESKYQHLAFRFILFKRINLHKEWLVRSYVITVVFVLFRWLTSQSFYYELGTFKETGATAIWISWVIPLFITEIILQWKKK